MLLLVGMVWEGGWVDKMARFVKVYRSHKLCRNVCSHNSYGNANGISPSYKGPFIYDVSHFGGRGGSTKF